MMLNHRLELSFEADAGMGNCNSQVVSALTVVSPASPYHRTRQPDRARTVVQNRTFCLVGRFDQRLEVRKLSDCCHAWRIRLYSSQSSDLYRTQSRCNCVCEDDVGFQVETFVDETMKR